VLAVRRLVILGIVALIVVAYLMTKYNAATRYNNPAFDACVAQKRAALMQQQQGHSPNPLFNADLRAIQECGQ
jgi:hypothetical protein